MGDEFTVPKPAWGDNAFLQIEGFQNFLASAAEVQLNQHLSPDGTSRFEMNLKDYSSLLVVIESEDQVAHLIVPVQPKPSPLAISQRDLSLINGFDSKKYFSEKRGVIKLLRGETGTIEDITSTEMQTIDSLKKVWQIQKDLARLTSDEVELI